MANYEVDLSPNIVNMATEGSMDTSLLNGKSIQRTFTGLMIVNNNNRKVVGRLFDGDQFDNTITGVNSGVFILTNNNYVDYQNPPSGSGREANNIIAIMENVGVSYQTFTDISESFFASLSSDSKLIIPEIEEDNLNPDLSSGAKNAIKNFVINGGTIVMFHPNNGDPLTVLNNVFNFSLAPNDVSTPINITQNGVALFPNEANVIPDVSATSSVDTTTLPENSVVIYEGDGSNQSVVSLINYENGKIYVLGWDFYDAPPLGGENEDGWNHLLETILKQ